MNKTSQQSESHNSQSRNSKRGYGITFIDLDETLFHTFAKVGVVKGGEVIKKLTNQEFNNYVLSEGETFEFSEFSDAELFAQTSVPIARTMKMIREMIGRIKETKSFSRIIVLTARQDFASKEKFLGVFTDNGIDVSDKKLFYIDRIGNSMEGSVAERKRNAILKYLSEGIYRRCRMIDDNDENLKLFMELGKNLPEEIKKKVRDKYNLSDNCKPIIFYALKIDEKERLKIMES
jgi:hypothetical protein